MAARCHSLRANPALGWEALCLGIAPHRSAQEEGWSPSGTWELRQERVVGQSREMVIATHKVRKWIQSLLRWEAAGKPELAEPGEGNRAAVTPESDFLLGPPVAWGGQQLQSNEDLRALCGGLFFCSAA